MIAHITENVTAIPQKPPLRTAIRASRSFQNFAMLPTTRNGNY